MDGGSKSRLKKWIHLSSYHITSRVMILKMSKMTRFISFANDSKKLIAVWAQHLSATGRSF